MTEQEEAVGRQRLGVLTKLETLLVEKETDVTVLYAKPHERNARAQKDYDELSSIVARLGADPSIPPVRLLDAELRVTAVTEQLATAQAALAMHTAEAAAMTATHQAAIDKATTEVTEAQAALDALKTP